MIDEDNNLEAKLQELDDEISRFRAQNEHLQAVQKDCEQALTRVNLEIEEFDRRKELERKEFEAWKLREREQLDKERQELAQDRD